MLESTSFTAEKTKTLNAEYDSVGKELLSNKELLAEILRNTVAEYQECSVEQVIRCIREVSDETPVEDVPARELSGPTELSSLTEKMLRFDFYLEAVNPKLTAGGITVYLHIDLEVQKKYRPEEKVLDKEGKHVAVQYPLIKRGIYYAARELSRQLSIQEGRSGYSQLEKVYSIWICHNVGKKLANTASVYSFSKKDIMGAVDEPEDDYDLMTVVIVRRGKYSEDAAPFFEFLDGVFGGKQDVLEKHLGPVVTPKLIEEVQKMGGMGELIFEQGIEQGKILGAIQILSEAGMSKEQIALKIMNKYGISSEQAREYIEEALAI